MKGADLYLYCMITVHQIITKIIVSVVIFLEISGKWPEDLDAIKAIKAEFHGKMCDMLQKDGITAVVFPGFLQILWVRGILTFFVENCCKFDID